MTVDRFVAERQARWLQLEQLLRRLGKGGIRRASAADVERLGHLYRRATSDLAIARRDFPADHLVDYLNRLCARAHPLLYQRHPLRPWAIGDFYARWLPLTLRRLRGYLAAAAALTGAGVVAGWLAVALRPDVAAGLVPDSLFDRMARGEVPTGTASLPGGPGLVASVIITNNIRVALVCFAGGLLLGIPTVLELVVNGWMLGTLAAAVHRDGFDVPFWSFIAPHGVVELSVVVIAGATGLAVGDALLRPGLQRRADRLSETARTAAGLAIGAASLLVVAGLVESFVSPSGLPAAAKYATGAATGVSLYGWLLLGGRRPRRRTAAGSRRPRPTPAVTGPVSALPGWGSPTDGSGGAA